MAREICARRRAGSARAWSRTADGLGVDRIDVRTLRTTRVERAQPARRRLYQRRPRQRPDHGDRRTLRGATGQLGSRDQLFLPHRGSRDWRPFGSYDRLTGEGMYPLAVDPDAQRRLCAAEAQRPLRALPGQARRLAGDRARLCQRAGRRRRRRLGRAAARASSASPSPTSSGGSSISIRTMRRSRARSGRAIPNLPLIDFGSASADGNQLLVHAGSDTDAGPLLSLRPHGAEPQRDPAGPAAARKRAARQGAQRSPIPPPTAPWSRPI